MGAGDVVRELAPWAATFAASVTAVGALGGQMGPSRLRSNIKRDQELWKVADKEAKTALGELLDHESKALRDRVVDGVRLSKFQHRALTALATLFCGLGVMIAGAVLGGTDALPKWFTDGTILVGFAVFGVACLMLVFAMLEGAYDWLNRRAPRGPSPAQEGPAADAAA